MPEFVIKAQSREITGKKVGRLRREGIVPINVYGPKKAPQNLQVPYRELEVALMRAGGTNIIDMHVDDGNAPMKVLARDVQRDILKGTIIHADFFAVDEDDRLVIEVPVVMINQSPAVESRKGILLTGPNSLSLEMTVSNMLNQVEVDLSSLTEVGDRIYVKDLTLGDKVKILNDPEEMLAAVNQTSAARRALMEQLVGGGDGEGEEGEGGEGEEEHGDE